MKKAVCFLMVWLLLFTPVFADETEEKIRIRGADRYGTAVAISREVFEQSDTVLLASGENFADALSASSPAYLLRAPLLLTERDRLPEATAKEIERLQAKMVYIVGGEAAVSDEVLQQLQGQYDVVRWAGVDRYDTSAMVWHVLQDKVPVKRMGVAGGEVFADALTAVPYLAKKQGALLLTDGWQLPLTARQDLSKTIFGGEKSVSQALQSNLSAGRIGGVDRYETARNILTAFEGEFNTVIVTSGKDFPDALAAVSLARKHRAPIVTADSIDHMDAIREIAGQRIRLIVVGGEASVSNRLVERWQETAETLPTPVPPKPAPVWPDTKPPISEEKMVNIPDPGLRKVINKNLDPERDDDQEITLAEIRSLKSLNVDYPDGTPIVELKKIEYEEGEEPLKDQMVKREIYSLEGLQFATQMEWLDISETYVKDIGPLRHLKELTYLELDRNLIEDVSPLAELTKLEHLKLYNNFIRDIGPLKDLTNLRYLDVHYNVDSRNKNGIEDIAAVANMKALELLDISANSITDITPMQGLENIKHLDMSNNHIRDIRPYVGEIAGLLHEMLVEENSEYSVGFMGQTIPLNESFHVTSETATLEISNPFLGYDALANHFDLATLFDMAFSETDGIHVELSEDGQVIRVHREGEDWPPKIDRISIMSFSTGFANHIDGIEILTD